ncbi:hypothetical protein [Treponema primitia]|uniref:hypothetical protein n=1 Tax=Treponema primitia TaxID=88058 RepID=UPI0002555424|nr:hypothetical protein [Treponema primitia]
MNKRNGSAKALMATTPNLIAHILNPEKQAEKKESSEAGAISASCLLLFKELAEALKQEAIEKLTVIRQNKGRL